MHDQQIETVAQTVKSLGHPVRLKILCILMDGEKSVGEIHNHFSSSLANVSQHIQKLMTRGLIRKEKRANYIYYSLADKQTAVLLNFLRQSFCPASAERA